MDILNLEYVRNNCRIFEDSNLYHRCIRVLQERQYQVSIVPAEYDEADDRKEVEKEVGFWVAKKSGNEFYGANPLTLLGVVSMWEHLGDSWRKKHPKSLYFEMLGEFYGD